MPTQIAFVAFLLAWPTHVPSSERCERTLELLDSDDEEEPLPPPPRRSAARDAAETATLALEDAATAELDPRIPSSSHGAAVAKLWAAIATLRHAQDADPTLARRGYRQRGQVEVPLVIEALGLKHAATPRVVQARRVTSQHDGQPKRFRSNDN